MDVSQGNLRHYKETKQSFSRTTQLAEKSTEDLIQDPNHISELLIL